MVFRILPVVLAVLTLACGFYGHPVLAAQPPEVVAAEPKPPTADPEAQFAAFLKKPTRENYLRVYKTVTSHPKYAPYSRDLDDVSKLLGQKKYQEALKKLDAAMPNLLLSPRAHKYAGSAASGAGDAERGKKEFSIASQCIKGILSTGDGSEEKPYLVTRVSDEYDVLRHLKKATQIQGLIFKDGKSYDRIQCTDGSGVWFDITAPFGRLGK